MILALFAGVPVFIVWRTNGTAGLRDWASVLVAVGLMLAAPVAALRGITALEKLLSALRSWLPKSDEPDLGSGSDDAGAKT
ncbi:MAG: hypothetical protein ACRDYX_20995 [Egibacteraceae bacterium]